MASRRLTAHSRLTVVVDPPRLVTDRLVLRGWAASDRDAFAAMNADPEVMHYFPAVQSRAESDAMVDRIEASFASDGFGLWALEHRDDGRFLGFTGLARAAAGLPVAGEVEVGWRLGRSAWGQGLATEAGGAALAYGFDTAGLDAVMSMTARVNVPSWRVMERLGMLRDRDADFDHPRLPLDSPLRRHVVHRRTRAQGVAPPAGDPYPERGVVEAVSMERRHRFSKPTSPVISLVAGVGVEGDAHAGVTVRHRSRRRWHPEEPNLRQVHLLHAELLDELRPTYAVQAGDIGENVLTRGIDLLGLPAGTRLHLGRTALVEVMGLRSPCVQLDRFADGLMQATLDRDTDGELVRKAGVMCVVLAGGDVRPGDPLRVELPPGEQLPLRPV